MNTKDSKDEGELILYRTEDGRDDLQLRLVDGTVWLTQAEIALLFETTPQNITQHLRAIYEQSELTPEATCKQSLQVRLEGEREVRRTANLYNLNAILAVGYRVRSARGVQFRRWATEVLSGYLVKGFGFGVGALQLVFSPTDQKYASAEEYIAGDEPYLNFHAQGAIELELENGDLETRGLLNDLNAVRRPTPQTLEEIRHQGAE